MALPAGVLAVCDEIMDAVELNGLGPLVEALRADGYRVIGPTVRDSAIVLGELASAGELPYGWGAALSPGGYRLRRRADRAAFGHAAGPQSWKAFLHPPRERLVELKRDPDGGFTATESSVEPARYAFLGVRPCDLRAIEVQDRVLGGGAYPESRYTARRAGTLLIAVNCTEPGATCFCAATGSGPDAASGFDLVLTELVDGDGEPSYLARAGTPAGERLLAAVPHLPADESRVAQAGATVAGAAERMGRSLPPGDLRGLLAGAHDAARWDDVARRCLTCGNCTMVCPTCFCTTVSDTTDLTGDIAQRWRRWDTCFDIDFSYLHGGAVRSSARSRYRQWLTHKFSAWHDQFGESGCVGCGRCVVWCPAGIDVTEELRALAEEVTS